MSNRKKTQEIQAFVLEKVAHYPLGISKMIQRKYGLSKQGAYYHLNALVKKGLLEAEGLRKSKRYRLKPTESWTKCYSLDGLKEDLVWKKVQELGKLPDLDHDKAGFTLMYGFTEMLNNAIDHSEGDTVCVTITIFHNKIKIEITDNGIGIFRKIQREENLENEREAILLLSKGKYTSNPEEHSGQGIFFTSKAFNFFDIISGDLCFIHERASCNDWLLDHVENTTGTTVVMELGVNSKLNMADLFDEYSSNDGEYSFDTTVVPVRKLRSSNEGLVSRSQAKRLMVGLQRFEQVRLDFKDIDKIGQAFADEIFRVWPQQNTGVVLFSTNTNKTVENMIQRALADNTNAKEK